ncbi:MAG: hypothetical protein H0U65_09390 [Rubrobacter sp.]|nr:hypothetical protein [Rubrobacter sp.]
MEDNDLRGTMRLDEQRAIIGLPAAAFESAEEQRRQFEEDTEAFEEELRELKEQEGEAPEGEAAPEQ